jgi:hypothetical protein
MSFGAGVILPSRMSWWTRWRDLPIFAANWDMVSICTFYAYQVR